MYRGICGRIRISRENRDLENEGIEKTMETTAGFRVCGMDPIVSPIQAH